MQELIDYIINHTERTQSLDANTVKGCENAIIFTLDSVKTKEITNKPISDVHFFKVAIKGDPIKEKFIELINEHYPNLESLRAGPSYTVTGAELGSQEIGLLFMGLGELLKVWKIITPATLGLPAEFAGRGYVMCSGYSG